MCGLFRLKRKRTASRTWLDVYLFRKWCRDAVPKNPRARKTYSGPVFLLRTRDLVLRDPLWQRR